MDSNQKPLYYMILFGVVRHVIGFIGVWMIEHKWIDTAIHERLMSEGVTQVVGYTLMAIPLIWSILQKTQVWGWVKKALHLPSSVPPAEVPELSPGPNTAI